MSTVAVLGAGNMGTALAQTIARNGQGARLWSIETDVLEEIRDRRTNSKYLGDLTLHERITPCWTLEEALSDAEMALFSVPSHIVRSLARETSPYISDEQAVLNVGKGLENDSEKRMSEVISEEVPRHGGIAAMGGPAIANEFARGAPTAVIVGAEDATLATRIQSLFQNEFFKVQTTTDVAGVELGASLKNAYAIALGMCDGLGHGANTKAFITSLALGELAALSTAMGGEKRTAYGLAGLGDLLTTGYSAHSRNRTFGEKLCTDPDWPDFVRNNTVEGIAACKAYELAHRLDVPTPLLHAIHSVVHLGEPPAETMRLFVRDFAFG